MDWYTEYADKLEFLEKVADQKGEDPPALAARPNLSDFVAPYFNAFADLSSQRTTGMSGADPILFSEIEVYLRLYDLHDLPMVVDVIVELDRHYLTEQRKRSDGANVSTKAHSKRGGRGSIGRKTK